MLLYTLHCNITLLDNFAVFSLNLSSSLSSSFLKLSLLFSISILPPFSVSLFFMHLLLHKTKADLERGCRGREDENFECLRPTCRPFICGWNRISTVSFQAPLYMYTMGNNTITLICEFLKKWYECKMQKETFFFAYLSCRARLWAFVQRGLGLYCQKALLLVPVSLLPKTVQKFRHSELHCARKYLHLSIRQSNFFRKPSYVSHGTCGL